MHVFRALGMSNGFLINTEWSVVTVLDALADLTHIHVFVDVNIHTLLVKGMGGVMATDRVTNRMAQII